MELRRIGRRLRVSRRVSIISLWTKPLQQEWGGIAYLPEQFSTGFGFVHLICQYRQTVLPSVWSSGFFWFVMLFHGLMQGIEHLLHNWDNYTLEYEWTGLTTDRPGW